MTKILAKEYLIPWYKITQIHAAQNCDQKHFLTPGSRERDIGGFRLSWQVCSHCGCGIKDKIFCFVHLQWCHNRGPSNILSGGCLPYQYSPWLKYCTPIHQHNDTIEGGQNKKSPLLFSCFVRNLLFCILVEGLFFKDIIASFDWHHLNNYSPHED